MSRRTTARWWRACQRKSGWSKPTQTWPAGPNAAAARSGGEGAPSVEARGRAGTIKHGRRTSIRMAPGRESLSTPRQTVHRQHRGCHGLISTRPFRHDHRGWKRSYQLAKRASAPQVLEDHQQSARAKNASELRKAAPPLRG